jgi:predicted esterase
VVFYGQFTNPKLATDAGFALVSVNPQADYLQTLFAVDILKVSNEIIAEICNKNQIPTDKVIVGGLSAAGMLALHLAEESHKPKTMKLALNPASAALSKACW